MDLQKMIFDSLGDMAAGKIADSVGVDRSTVDKVIDAGVPVIVGRLGKNVQDPEGASSLDAALSKDHSGSLLDNLGSLFGQGDQDEDGDKILGHVFGDSKTAVEGKIAKKTGVDLTTVAKVLSFIAPIILAQLGKQKKSGGLDVDGLKDMLGGQTNKGGNLLVDMVTDFIDKDDDGNVLDELMGIIRK